MGAIIYSIVFGIIITALCYLAYYILKKDYEPFLNGEQSKENK